MLVTGAMSTYPDGLETESRKAHIFLQQIADPYLRKADKWHEDFERAWRHGYKGKTITMWAEYVDAIAKDGQTEAATWFLTTGGKYGFVDRAYFPGEEELMKSAINTVAQQHIAKGQDNWIRESESYKADKNATYGYLKHIEKMINDLQKQVTGLTADLKQEKAERKNETDHLHNLLSKEKEEREKETSGLKYLLTQEKEERKEESKSLKARADLAEEKAEKERNERIAAENNFQAQLEKEKHQRLLSEQNLKSEHAQLVANIYKNLSEQINAVRKEIREESNADNESTINRFMQKFQNTEDVLKAMMANAEKEAKERAEAAEKRHKEEMDRMTRLFKQQTRQNANLIKIILDQSAKSHRSRTHDSSNEESNSSSSSSSRKHSKTHREKSVTQTNMDNVLNIPSRNVSSSPKGSNKSPRLKNTESFRLNEISKIRTVNSSIVSIKGLPFEEQSSVA